MSLTDLDLTWAALVCTLQHAPCTRHRIVPPQATLNVAGAADVSRRPVPSCLQLVMTCCKHPGGPDASWIAYPNGNACVDKADWGVYLYLRAALGVA